MNLRDLQSRKSIKFLTLLLTATIIASASATAYFGLTMKPKVTTAAVAVKFVSGGDSTTAGASISTDGTWVALTGLKAYPNVTSIYEKAVNVSNTSGAAHDIRLRHVSIDPPSGWDVANFTSITFKLVNTAGSTIATLTYQVTGSGASTQWILPSPTSPQPLPDNTEWTIRVEVVAVANAVAGRVINIEIAVDVQP